MQLSEKLGYAVATLITFMAEPALSRISPSESPAAICFDAAEEASKQTGVPLNVLIALTLTETGRRVNGTFAPWPWALNQAGESYWFSSQDETLSALSKAVGEGKANIDIGCFQLNYRWHVAAFPSIEAMLDPFNNAVFAAQLVLDRKKEDGSWMQAAGAFHSTTPDVAKRYLVKFEQIFFALDKPENSLRSAVEVESVNGFSLLQPLGTRSTGSIVPLTTNGRSIIGGR